MAVVDLRTLPQIEQHHPLAFNHLGRTGHVASDFLWICPECNDGKTHVPCMTTGGLGYAHIAQPAGDYEDAVLHQLVAVDVIAVLEQYRQALCNVSVMDPDTAARTAIDNVLAIGAQQKEN